MRTPPAFDRTLYPETAAFFELNNIEDFSDFELATALVKCDKTMDMPKELFDFVVGLYESAIEEGNDFAMNDLGALYYNGRGGEQNFERAVYYYEMAAKNGNRQAQENLGYCYYYGRSVDVDYKKAFHYFALGAFDGHLVSLYKIGDMYMNGYYVEYNPAEAFPIYERCIEMMTDEAAPTVAGPVFLRLGNAFLYGNGTEENAKSALVCFQKAELFLYDMVASGEWMYNNCLKDAIEGQNKAREILIGDTLRNQ
jgi:TPR repeat protein